MQQWDIADHALSSADRHYAETLAPPHLPGLTASLVPKVHGARFSAAGATSRMLYAEMVREVQDLLRDVRFLTGTGLMLVLDASEATRELAESDDADEVLGLFLTEGEIAVLRAGDQFVPPSTLATDRHRHIGDGQTLGRWFGGMLLDTALVKCHGLLDRLVAALWCHAQLPVPATKQGALMYPTFVRRDLKLLREVYGSDPSWTTFASLLDSSLAEELTRFRHDGTHKRRAGSELNGGGERWHADEVNPDAPRHRVVRGMSVVEHANAPLETYRELVLPAARCAAEMISRYPTPQ